LGATGFKAWGRPTLFFDLTKRLGKFLYDAEDESKGTLQSVIWSYANFLQYLASL